MAEYGSGLVRINSSWANLKTIVVAKNLSMQYDESSTAYDIFAIDGSIVYYILIFKGVVPDSSFNQVQNDADKADFETNYKNLVTNRPTTPSATYDGYAVTTANPTLIAASDGSFVKTVRADTSGRLITVGLGTAGSPAGGVLSIQGVSGGQAIPISGTVSTTNASTGATGASPPAQATYIGGLSTTAAPSYTNGQLNAISLTLAGAIRIDGSAVTQPVSGTVTANAGTGTFTVAGTVTANAGTGNFTVVQSTASNLNATVVQATAANLRSQTASEFTTATALGTIASLMGGSVTTAAPTYTTGQMNALSLTTSGLLRIDGSGVTQPVSGTVTANAGTGNFTVVQSTAANLRAQTGSEATTATATGTVASLTGGAVTTAAPTYTTGQMNPLSLTTAGALRIDGSGVTQPISGTVTVGNLLVVAGQSTDNSANSTAKLAVIPAVATTAAPTYSSGNMVPLSLTTAGALRVDGSAVTQPISGTVSITGLALPFNIVGNAAAGAAPSGAPVLTAGTDGSVVRTYLTDTSGRQYFTQQDISVTGTLGALNATVAIVPSGKYTIGGTITGTWVGTITAQGTIDGTNWFTVRTANKSTNDIIQTYTANDSFEFYSVAGCIGLRLQMTAYTSGTANITLTGTSLATDAFLNYSGTTNDGVPPQRHVSIGTLTTDGTTFHALYNSNTAPVGDEYGLITRSIGYGDQQSSFSPDPISHTTGSTGETFVDDSNNLQVRGQVLTDEGSFRDDFTGSSLTTALSGTPSWTNGSTTVTGTSFQTTVKSGDYIKKTADANTLYVRVLSVDSDTSLTLETAYTGTTAAAASVKSNWIPTIGASGTIAVGTSNLTITTGTTNGVINNIIRRGDYGPVTMRIYASVSQRIANQELRLGFSDNVASLTPNIAAYVSFTGTNNTVCNFVTSSSTAAADTQTTAVTLPSGNTAALHEYKIDIGHSQATLSIDGTVVARNTIHIPGPYDSLDLMCLAANTGTAGSSTTLTVDYAYFMNANRVQIDDDFNGEALYVQGNGFAGSPPTSGVLGVMAPDNAFSGAFSGLNSTWVVTLTGSKGMGFTLAAGTLIGTIVAEISFNGSNWFPTSMNDPVNNISSSSLVFTSANGAVVRSIETVAGAFQARVRISAYTSGTANITIRATQLENTLKTITSTDGNRTTYSASFNGLVAASSPTDIWTISGSSSRTIRIARITVTATQSTSAQRDVLLIKRSSANTGGTSTTATIASHDSNNIAPTAVVRGYTANPSGLGTSAGVLRTRKVFIGAGTSNSDEFLIEFGTRNDQALVLRGTTEFACINLNGVTSASNSFNISVTWTEE